MYEASLMEVIRQFSDFDFLDYPVTEMTDEQIKATIKAFGEATRRAYEAGFDGVEIHGANHYLIQQFFLTTQIIAPIIGVVALTNA